MGGACSTYGGEVHRGFWWVNIREKPTGRTRRRWEDNTKMDLQEVYVEAWIGSIWLRIETSHGHL